MTHYHRGDYVKLTVREPRTPTQFNGQRSEFVYNVWVVASDEPQYYDKHNNLCWIIAVHDNNWDAVGTGVSRHYIDRHEPVVLHRNQDCCS